MRAVVFSSSGEPGALHVADLPIPEPGPNQVRVQVAAATVNPVDVATGAGLFASMLPPGEYVLGWDVAGTVDALGSGVSAFQVGDRVAGFSLWFQEHTGTYAEYVVLPVTALAPVPETLALIDAATVPLNALTADQALELIAPREGQTLVVTGAAGGVGGYAVQLATRRGLRVVAMAGAQDEELVRGLGATAFVPRGEDPATALRAAAPQGADAILDAANLGAAALPALRDQGTFVAVTDPAAPPPERGITVHTVRVHYAPHALADLLRLAAKRELAIRVAQTYSFDQAADAHTRLSTGGIRGRLVLTP